MLAYYRLYKCCVIVLCVHVHTPVQYVCDIVADIVLIYCVVCVCIITWYLPQTS